jgi:hypothetical protein
MRPAQQALASKQSAGLAKKPPPAKPRGHSGFWELELSEAKLGVGAFAASLTAAAGISLYLA